MPRETIKYAEAYVVREKGDLSVVVKDIADPGEQQRWTEGITAHWSKGLDGVAQLSIALDVNMVRDVVKMYDEGHRSNASSFFGEGMVEFYTTDWDRNELQRLIKLARQMRDDVHQPDA